VMELKMVETEIEERLWDEKKILNINRMER
jgi:hypothetical protein